MFSTKRSAAANVFDTGAAGVESESFAEHTIPAADTSRLVVATFNIRYAVGSFLITGSLFRRAGITRPDRRPRLVEANVGKAARAFNDGRLMPRADVVALQEADAGTIRAGRLNVARELARSLRMSYARAGMPTPRDRPPIPRQWWLDFEEHIRMGEVGTTGVALLSRHPVAHVERVDLPWMECEWRPHVALGATIRVGRRRLHVFNAHIDPHAAPREQLAQHAAILERAEGMSEPEDATLLLGDFNTLSRQSLMATRDFLESRGYTTPLPTGTATWRAGLYRLHADWIFVRGALVRRWGIARPLSVSDHWPVWAEVDLG